jgi:hypothetical protein
MFSGISAKQFTLVADGVGLRIGAIVAGKPQIKCGNILLLVFQK